MRAWRENLRLVLRADRELRCKEGVLLWHRRLGAIHHVVDELPAVRRLHPLAVDVVRPLLIDDEEMIAAGPAGDVDVLAKLDVAVGAEDGHATIAPGREPIRSEPVHPDVARASVSAHHDVAEVLELWMVRMPDVPHLRGDDLARGRAGEEEELVELV